MKTDPYVPTKLYNIINQYINSKKHVGECRYV
jgi:hypothetical protein